MHVPAATRSRRRWPWVIALALVASVPVGLASLSITSPGPGPLGLIDGRLAGCPDSPNCVSCEAPDEPHHVAPLEFASDPQEAFARLRRLVESLPGAKLEQSAPTYLRFTFTTRLFRFVDDVEFQLVEDAREIRCRSASRAGHSDLGVNRARIEQIRDRFASDAD